MSYEAIGAIIFIGSTEQVTETFRKREFALEIADGEYSQKAKFQATNDRCGLLDGIGIGDMVRIQFNVKGREYTRKTDGVIDYWTNLEAWKIEVVGTAEPQGETDKTALFDDIPF